MPNIKSAKKRMRQNVKRRTRNRIHRAALRGAVRKVRAGTSGEEAVAAFASAESMLDRAAQRNLIHPNKAARQKSRLRKYIASLDK